MENKNNKEQYLSPEVESFELKTEGVICASGDPQNYVDPFGGTEIVF